MKTIASLLSVVALSLSLTAAHAQGEAGHCHNQLPGGQLVEADDLPTRQACDAEGGTWFRQAEHCHKLGKDGKVSEIFPVQSRKECEAKAGQWTDHRQVK